MRRILVDYARRRRRQKRGGNSAQQSLNDSLMTFGQKRAGLVALDDALLAHAGIDARLSRVVGVALFRRVDCRGNRGGVKSIRGYSNAGVENG
jgi:hypothetical protein